MAFKSSGNLTLTFLIALVLSFYAQTLEGQYFGRNKPKYNDPDFKICKTEHFEIYYYNLDSIQLKKYANWFELWYDAHSAVLDESFKIPNPVLLYNHHGDFQQTNAISGSIDVGTGGVTEGLRNRVVLPVAITNQQTFHVIGHELVHAFQYRMILGGDSTGIESLANFPLWMIEGLAEYMSVGSIDPHTAMWMRDAAMRNDIPKLEKMHGPEYFPYRYGHAFWSFFGGTFGDDKIKPFFMSTAMYGLPFACDTVLHISIDSLSNYWQKTMTKHFKAQINSIESSKIPGKPIITGKNAGDLNISPSLSPNGKYITFLSEKDLLTIDLYLADANSGEIKKKLYSAAKGGHVDHLNFIESSGTWSPDSKQFAFIGFEKGKSVLIIKNIENGGKTKNYSFNTVPYFVHPSWSPDGKHIVVSGLANGQTDLYLINLKENKIKQLTNDPYAEIQADWSTDGSKIVVATDQRSLLSGRVHGKWNSDIGIVDLDNGTTTILPVFEGAGNFNPHFDKEGNIIFLSDHDGFRNIYLYNPDSNIVKQLTKVKTGISGLTPYAPAISVANKIDKLVFTIYEDNKYTIQQALIKNLLNEEVENIVDLSAARLPGQHLKSRELVNKQLEMFDQVAANRTDSTYIKPYRSQFGLIYMGASGGAGVGNLGYRNSGVGVGGGIDLLFSDILGNHQLYTGVGANGDLYDILGNFQYLNQAGRLPWGISLGHNPVKTGFTTYGSELREYIDSEGQKFFAITDTTDLIRIFEDQLNVYVQYPFSVTRRIELGGGMSYRYFRRDQVVDFYSDQSRFTYYGSQKTNIPIDGDLIIGPYIFNEGLDFVLNTAYVGDNSFFGMTSPMAGWRYRFGLNKYFGNLDYFEGIADARKYFWFKPLSLSLRGMIYSRFGEDSESLYPELLGQTGLMHGYDYRHIEEVKSRYDINFYQISGSKLAVANVELRFPLLGPKKFALIPFSYLPVELAWFLDGGLAFNSFDDFDIPVEESKPIPIFSSGIGVRVNLFGVIILEPYWAWPLQENSKAQFGLNFAPGW